MPASVPNARVARTHARLLRVAHTLLPIVGPARLTFTLLAEHAQITRQTVYRHWPTREALLAELVFTNLDVGYPTGEGDLRATIIQYLSWMTAGMADRRTAAGLLTLVVNADRDAVSGAGIAESCEARRRALNELILRHGRQLTTIEYIGMSAPISYSQIVNRSLPTAEFIGIVVDKWLRPDPTPGDTPLDRAP